MRPGGLRTLPELVRGSKGHIVALLPLKTPSPVPAPPREAATGATREHRKERARAGPPGGRLCCRCAAAGNDGAPPGPAQPARPFPRGNAHLPPGRPGSNGLPSVLSLMRGTFSPRPDSDSPPSFLRGRGLVSLPPTDPGPGKVTSPAPGWLAGQRVPDALPPEAPPGHPRPLCPAHWGWGHSLGNRIFVFSAGRPSRFPDGVGREAELPSDKLPLLISFSHGDLATMETGRGAIGPSGRGCDCPLGELPGEMPGGGPAEAQHSQATGRPGRSGRDEDTPRERGEEGAGRGRWV